MPKLQPKWDKSLALFFSAPFCSPPSICVVWCRLTRSVSNNGWAPRAPAVNRELPHSATPSTAMAQWQGRDDIYQAGLATCRDIYPRLCLTRAAPPCPSEGAAARGAKWHRKVMPAACVWDGLEGGSFIIAQRVGKKMDENLKYLWKEVRTRSLIHPLFNFGVYKSPYS